MGKTIYDGRMIALKTDHPHAGGENTGSESRMAGAGGPSPRGWGKRIENETFPSPFRTIPTRVGKTKLRTNLFNLYADHPHAGGENKRLRLT